MNKERQKFRLASLLRGFSDISFLFLLFGTLPIKKRKSLPVLVFLRMSLLRRRAVAFILSTWSLHIPLYKKNTCAFSILLLNLKKLHIEERYCLLFIIVVVIVATCILLRRCSPFSLSLAHFNFYCLSKFGEYRFYSVCLVCRCMIDRRWFPFHPFFLVPLGDV